MKQPEDNATIDMFESAPSKYRFRFYVTTREGVTTEWTGLTAKRAKDMYAYTSQSQPSNVTAFGWEEVTEIKWKESL